MKWTLVCLALSTSYLAHAKSSLTFQCKNLLQESDPISISLTYEDEVKSNIHTFDNFSMSFNGSHLDEKKFSLL
ncbi:MAG: hypothetical protein CME66_02455 [Halobacteriovoraceae bacterium]|jgi:hypothetical protein|nr:hypothetical protein [Halobacteriovoraceae bacterium]